MDFVYVVTEERKTIRIIIWIGEYIKNSAAQKDFKNDFQEDEPYAPDNTVSLKIIKKNKNIGGKNKKITQKIFTLDNGAQHIVEIEEK